MARRILSLSYAILPFLLLCLCSVMSMWLASAAGQPAPTLSTSPPSSLSPEELFHLVSSSVLVVEGLGPDGKVLRQGSGVVVASEGVVTNRHVVERAATIRLRQGKQTWAASISHVDPQHDLVQLHVATLPASPVSIRPSTALKTGERVYAIGAPEGFELTLSEGLISSLRPYEKVRLIQTSAPISPGSSGGGLFDVQGHLIGITTFQVKEGQNLNFALPGEWVASLSTYSGSPPATQDSASSLDDPVVWFYVGIEASRAQEWTQAVAAYREALRLKPDLEEVWYNLGTTYMRLNQYAEAITAFREALRLDPNYGEAWNNLGVARSATNHSAEAITAFREALRLDPNYAEAWYNLGSAYSDLNQVAQAITAFREAVRLNPTYASAWYNLGNAYGNQGQSGLSISALREAARLRPDHARTWISLGVLYGKQGQYALAAQVYREALRLDPDDVSTWYDLGLVYVVQGDRSRVRQVHQQIKTLDPRLADEFLRRFILP